VCPFLPFALVIHYQSNHGREKRRFSFIRLLGWGAHYQSHAYVPLDSQTAIQKIGKQY